MSFALRETDVVIRNSSTYAQLDVIHELGTRFLFPGEELTITSSASVIVPGSAYRHTLDVTIHGPGPIVISPSGTRPLIASDFTVPQERRATLIALCAARFYPDRFGAALLTATEIALLASKADGPLTSKAVNNKLQRLRNDVADRLGIYLDSREDLADWAIRHGHITKNDVDELLGR